MRAPLLIVVGIIPLFGYFAAISPRAWAGDATIITHANAPLGLSLAEAKRRFPRCLLSDFSHVDELSLSVEPPLTGYWPPFLEILPTFNDTFLSSPNEAMYSKVPLPGGAAATLDGSVLQRVLANCDDPNDANAPEYEYIVFQSKVMTVIKETTDKAAASAEGAMDDLAVSLTGQRGPTHRAVAIDRAAPVLVTYSDDGSRRTILETEERFSSGQEITFVIIAYIDIPLWQNYSAGVTKKLKGFAAQRSNESEALKKGI